MSDTPKPSPDEEPEAEPGPGVIGQIGAEQRPPAPRADQPQPRRRRRLSGLACAAFFLAGILGGASVGFLFLGRRISRQEDAGAEPNRRVPPEASPGEEAAPRPPAVVFSATRARPEQTPEVLEAGAAQIYCFFDIPHAPPSAEVAARWLHEADAPLTAEGEQVKEEGDHLRGHLVLQPPAGAKSFAEGIYELQFLVDGAPVTDASFALVKGAAELTKTPEGLERYRPTVEDLVVSAGPARRDAKKPFVLPARPSKVQASFKYSHAVPGTAFTVYWLYEDGLVAQATTEIDIREESGSAEAWLSPKPPQVLPTGKYAVEISVAEGTPALARTDFWIGRKPRKDELRPRR